MTSPQSPTHAIERKHVLESIRDYKPGKGMNAVPGMPVSHVSLTHAAALHSLLDDGTLQVVEVTKPSKIDSTRTMTYSYLIVAVA